jgi:hypothetical protein
MLEWVITNWASILAVLGALHALALAVVNLTATPDDDALLAKAYRVVEMVAGIFTAKAKQ